MKLELVQRRDLNEAVEGLLKMIRRLIGEDVELIWEPASGLWPIKIDPSQVNQMLTNLCVNARDAILGVGKIIIETENKVLDEAYCESHSEAAPGEYVMLAVTDTGRGMDKETCEKIFDPFFTTKEIGEGTGLGLSTIYGIVKQNGGFINVYSELGKGTTFKIYFPKEVGEVERGHLPERRDVPRGKGEEILFVEDEEAFLMLGKTVIERLGYRVLAAREPSEAIRIAKEKGGTIDLLITDVVVPEMNGKKLAQILEEICPELKVLFMSGYTSNVIAHQGILEDGVNFIQKPFSIKEIASKIREVFSKEHRREGSCYRWQGRGMTRRPFQG